jgi:hypothetical protein
MLVAMKRYSPTQWALWIAGVVLVGSLPFDFMVRVAMSIIAVVCIERFFVSKNA